MGRALCDFCPPGGGVGGAGVDLDMVAGVVQFVSRGG